MTPESTAGAASAPRQRCVLVFSGADPSGGAGISADILAIHAQGAHALPVITALTVQDNERVYEVLPVAADVVLRQARALTARVKVDAVKIGIPGSAANARVIAQVIGELRAGGRGQTGVPADLPVVLDPVLASGHGDLLSRDDAAQALAVLLPLVTLITPNGPEAAALALAAVAVQPAADAQPGQRPQPVIPDRRTAAHAGIHAELPRGGAMDSRLRGNDSGDQAGLHAQALLAQGCQHVLITGGHDGGDTVINRWFSAYPGQGQSWTWARLSGEFHGSGCTLAAAIAGLLAHGYAMPQALASAQGYCHGALAAAFAIAPGQRIPQR
jgi:hydroxymethylpyrimidine/phosphomethylpyrimidine kinase